MTKNKKAIVQVHHQGRSFSLSTGKSTSACGRQQIHDSSCTFTVTVAAYHDANGNFPLIKKELNVMCHHGDNAFSTI